MSNRFSSYGTVSEELGITVFATRKLVERAGITPIEISSKSGKMTPHFFTEQHIEQLRTYMSRSRSEKIRAAKQRSAQTKA